MSGNSGVYLVSQKTFGDENGKNGKNNPAFDSIGEEKVGYNASSGVDIREEPKRMPDKPYRGMGKEELLHFSSQPFWRRLRMIFVAFIILVWLALIITVVALVLVYPRCRDYGSRSWWQNEAVYRIYTPSFKDSNADGVGDLKGIESKLDYIKDLGFGVISLSPFYKTSPSTDFKTGNDLSITNHSEVDAAYGDLAAAQSLIKTAHDKGIYVVVDFIPGVTGTDHTWFTESETQKLGGAKKNYYIWDDGKAGTTPPSNWISRYGSFAWTNDTTRNQWYLHQLRPETPSLNLRSALVQQELEAILEFWLDQGVDGFNVRDSSYLYVDYDLRDESLKAGATAGSTAYGDYDHVYTSNQPEVYSILDRWRKVLRAHNKTTTEKLLMVGVSDGLVPQQLYGDCDVSGVQMPLHPALGATSCDAACITAYVDDWMAKVPSGKWANWMTGDDNTERLGTRFNASFVHAYTVLTMLLPGTPVMYYGDEINMADTVTSGNAWSREQPMRSVMLWDDKTDGGFCDGNCTTANIWTTVTNGTLGNVATGTATIELIKELFALRVEPSFRIGDFAMALRDGAVVSFVREFDGETGYLVAINFGPNEETRDFTGSHDTIMQEAVVALVSGSDYELEDDVDTSDITLAPYSALVASWDYVAKEL